MRSGLLVGAMGEARRVFHGGAIASRACRLLAAGPVGYPALGQNIRDIAAFIGGVCISGVNVASMTFLGITDGVCLSVRVSSTAVAVTSVRVAVIME